MRGKRNISIEKELNAKNLNLSNTNKSKKAILICSSFAFFMIIAICFISLVINKPKKDEKLILAENKRAANYNLITDEDSKIDQTDNVTFSSFFLRDLDGDGIAEKYSGTCKDLNAKDILYMDLNVLSNGRLEDGKITIEADNFKYKMSMIKDRVLKKNYVSDDVRIIELNTVVSGTQKLILGNIISNIGEDITNYCKDFTVTLTGTYVSDVLDEEENEIRIPISKTVTLTSDWYGTIRAEMNGYPSSNFYYNYDSMNTNTVDFSFTINEKDSKLILDENTNKVTIPTLFDFAPTNVVCTNSNVEYNYNEITRELTITRKSIIDGNGVLNQSLSRTNTYTISVTYPEEAFSEIKGYTVLTVPVEGYYTGYNNPNEEFENPYKSNIANTDLKLIFRQTPQPTGYTYNFYVDIVSKEYVSEPYYRYVISKQDILNMYNGESSIENKEFLVKWTALRGNQGEVSKMVMNETNTESPYGDKWDEIVMDEFITYTGIYFVNADSMLKDDGKIIIYNNDTNEIIKEFTKEEWNTYTKENPYKYDEEVKHIRVETSEAEKNSYLYVYNIKKIDVEKILMSFTKEQVENIGSVNTYLTGTCVSSSGENGTSNDYDSVYFISEKSYAKLDLSATSFSTQETIKNYNISIETKADVLGEAKWQNGCFIVEVPEEIINMEINNVFIDNENVTIKAYDLYKENDKYFIKIFTENGGLDIYTITINCNISADPRISTTNNMFKLYAYNKFAHDYIQDTPDIYDVNSNNNIEEKVGYYSKAVSILSPTELITLEYITDYDSDTDGEITVAPNVAEVTEKAREAKINISLSNNYPNTVSGVKIIGKIPFEGNNYIINGKNMNSKYTTLMKDSGIHISEDNPDGSINGTKIYYSEAEKPTTDLEDISNGWKTKDEVTNWDKIKSYLIWIDNYEIRVGEDIRFDYIVRIPENISLNHAFYSNHAVFFSLETDDGALDLHTEPNKVGIKVVKKFDLEINKYKINSNLVIPGVTYSLKYTEENTDGIETEKTKLITTNSEGKVVLKDLNVGIEYTLFETYVPDECELNEDIIKFKINDEGNLEFTGNAKSYGFENNTLKIDLEDEVKYNLEVRKNKIGTDLNINNVRFSLVDENGNKQNKVISRKFKV